MLDGSPKLIAIDEQPNHQIVHMLCLRKADRPAYQPLDPCAQVDVLALNLLGVCLPHGREALPHPAPTLGLTANVPWTTAGGPTTSWPYTRQRLGHAHPALRPVRVTCRLFPLVTALPSTRSAARLGALFAGFFGTMLVSDCSGPCITGVELHSSRCGPRNQRVASPELSQFPRKECTRMLRLSAQFIAVCSSVKPQL
jgi:hypothetical protein